MGGVSLDSVSPWGAELPFLLFQDVLSPLPHTGRLGLLPPVGGNPVPGLVSF